MRITSVMHAILHKRIFSVCQIHDVPDWTPGFFVFAHLDLELLDVVHQIGHHSNQHQRCQSPPRCWSPGNRACHHRKQRTCHPCSTFTSLEVSSHHHCGHHTHNLFHLCSTNEVLLIESFAHQSDFLHEVFSAFSGERFCIQIGRIFFCRNSFHQKPFLSHCLLVPKDSCWKMFCSARSKTIEETLSTCWIQSQSHLHLSVVAQSTFVSKKKLK